MTDDEIRRLRAGELESILRSCHRAEIIEADEWRPLAFHVVDLVKSWKFDPFGSPETSDPDGPSDLPPEASKLEVQAYRIVVLFDRFAEELERINTFAEELSRARRELEREGRGG